ncbi:Hypothetical Protein FCC1311_099832 [Hondaea fermentalgiana]|uniref:Uncharacterized protein n=1 Tax=Hondaea fermentalgiana TaxID=2315210 RepID=A0A2R5GSD6_9STRA|nr:Hypothetical Protein FCC1311_099832 [Hondaea fermentalgiana]|eukprot:GBG33760.1 Hypothetical Protein FCC1311_099832 [Hondaea fermentalgiana]
MKALRKEWKKEVLKDVQEKLRDRERRVAKGREKQLAEERAFQEAKARALADRTSIELTALEAYRENNEALLQERRAKKMERRKEVLEKLNARQKEVEREKSAMLEALAREAHLWFTKEDLDNGTLDAKLGDRLVKVQPITASWQSALPKHHHADAQMFITDDSDMIFDAELFEEFARSESMSGLRR